MRRMHGTWYASDISIAWCASEYASSTDPGERTRRGNSPCPAESTNARSSCPVRVGMPVAGPGRIPSATTTGVSSIPASESASTIRANPPPEVATIDRAPAYEAPIAMFRAAISSSACSNTRPSGGPSTESPCRMPLPGVIGYPAANLHPPATAPRASASFPDRIIRGWNAASGRRYAPGTRPSAHPVPSCAAFRFFSRKSPLNSRARTRSTVSFGIPSALAMMPAPTMFPRIGLPAATAISLSGAASTRWSAAAPAGTSHTTRPAGGTDGRRCGRCPGSSASTISASSRPARTGTSRTRTE
ncbi:MAG: hypothetical protein H6Q83_2057 [Deltaproteobacteria bacterium]|nr:hypothetical protein [Deltaproteobacteria bacterium]